MNESRLQSSIILRMFIIAGLTIVLLIPTVFVESLVRERMVRRDDAAAEVSRSWVGPQTLTGPVLTIPFKEYARNDKGEVTFSVRNAHFLPADLRVRGTLQPEIRYRGIYEVALYQVRLSLDGQFAAPDMRSLHINPGDVLWDESFVSFGISDLKGIRDTVSLRWNGTQCPSSPGVLSDDIFASGITFKPRIGEGNDPIRFSFPLCLNGSSEMRVVPVGETNEVVLDSRWGDPSFIGGFLPAMRVVTPDSFHAEWKVLNLNRNFPQAWIGRKYDVAQASFGTSLYLSVDEYQKTSRSVKYALLFIALTFAAFFLSELMAKTNFHPIQYALVGLALLLFYVLLLSFSEHLGFNTAYGIASTATVLLVTVYASWIAPRKSIAVVIFAVLAVLYGFLFVTLQLQDYALLLGSVGLFIVLSLVMYLTRSIDWSGASRSPEAGRKGLDDAGAESAHHPGTRTEKTGRRHS